MLVTSDVASEDVTDVKPLKVNIYFLILARVFV